jgi:sRNA-binding regulator protein Hfq
LNRKLIRPKLTEVGINRPPEEPRARPSIDRTGDRARKNDGNPNLHRNAQGQGQGKPASQSAQKKTPPQDTNAEIFYYKKQIEGHVPMVILLQDGEKIFGTIEWYDRHALKVNREGEPNIVLLKHNIKYMYKDPDKA